MKPYYEHDGITLYNGHCAEILPQLTAVDVVVTDPPYSENVHSKQMSGGNTDGSISHSRYLGFNGIRPWLLQFCAEEFARLCCGWCLIFSDVELASTWRKALTQNGLEYVRTGAWVKLNCTPQFTGDRPGVGFEAITIAHPKGKKRWNGGGRPALWTAPIVMNRSAAGERRMHTTQKPLRLMAALLSDFASPGDVVLDPFAGSGTTLVSAKKQGLQAIGVELSEKYCETIAIRLEQGVMDFDEVSA